jgi:antitoxin (DNA-binding transcriptional repressor) of toxin-antitoxin stability system
MQFITTRELRNSPQIWDSLSRNEDIVVTNNGKPAAFIVGIPNGLFEPILEGIRRTKLELNLPLTSPAERAAAWHDFFDAIEMSPNEDIPEFERVNFERELDL